MTVQVLAGTVAETALVEYCVVAAKESYMRPDRLREKLEAELEEEILTAALINILVPAGADCHSLVGPYE